MVQLLLGRLFLKISKPIPELQLQRLPCMCKSLASLCKLNSDSRELSLLVFDEYSWTIHCFSRAFSLWSFTNNAPSTISSAPLLDISYSFLGISHKYKSYMFSLSESSNSRCNLRTLSSKLDTVEESFSLSSIAASSSSRTCKSPNLDIPNCI